MADYVISNHKYGSDIEQAIRKLRDPMEGFVDLHKPPPLTVKDPTFDDKLIQQERIKSYISRENALKDNTTKVYGIVWRQCTSALQAIVKRSDEYEDRARRHDLIWLLKELKKSCLESIQKLTHMRHSWMPCCHYSTCANFQMNQIMLTRIVLSQTYTRWKWQKEFISSVPMS